MINHIVVHEEEMDKITELFLSIDATELFASDEDIIEDAGFVGEARLIALGLDGL